MTDCALSVSGSSVVRKNTASAHISRSCAGGSFWLNILIAHRHEQIDQLKTVLIEKHLDLGVEWLSLED